MQQWNGQGLGIEWVTVMLENQDGSQPPTLGAAEFWKNTWGIQSAAVGIDPAFQMVPGTQVGTPQLTIIDPRTMVVHDLQEGYSGNHSKLTSLASSNM